MPARQRPHPHHRNNAHSRPVLPTIARGEACPARPMLPAIGWAGETVGGDGWAAEC